MTDLTYRSPKTELREPELPGYDYRQGLDAQGLAREVQRMVLLFRS